jgi:D-alanyl-lipoteichoic acid acyltransferase DltB (MBOAT superfamily)
LTSFYGALLIENTNKKYIRQIFLFFVLLINLAILGFFKYAGFFYSLFVESWNVEISDHSFSVFKSIILPVGISFYTFQSLSYALDVYRRKISVEPNIAKYILYVAFFPQLVAGPIVRAGEFLYQLSRSRSPRVKVFFWGAYLIIRGLFFKIVVADNLGEIIDQYWPLASQPEAPETLAFTLLILFSCQLLCDFMGYTDIARGIAYQLGFRLPLNFNAPYLAATFSSFWHRWHITLSNWMRDYIYISLGGSRNSLWLTLRNLMIVMLISGFWHGAGLNFIVWGGVLGLGLIIERLVQKQSPKIYKDGKRLALPFIMRVCLWYLVVQLTWILSMAFFRSQDIVEAWQVLLNAINGLIMLPTNGLTLNEDRGHMEVALWLVLPVVILHLRTLFAEQFSITSKVWERCTYAGFMSFSLLTLYATDQKFIYFQF